jgi:FkbM family methyltransferase
MKKILRKLIAQTGYKIVRDNKVPEPTTEIFDWIFRARLEAKHRLNFIQVGACDGVVSDQARSFIRDTRCHSILVEPIPANFAELSRQYEGLSNVMLLNAAVDTSSGKRAIHSVINQGRWLDSPVAKQLASFDRGHLLRFGVFENEIETISVQCMTLDEIYSAAGFDNIDILQVDTEGFDAEVVKMALKSNKLPEIIYFENSQIRKKLKNTELSSLYDSLKMHGYKWVHDLRNTLAIHKDA